MKLYQLPVVNNDNYATTINVDNINFIYLSEDEDGWFVSISFSSVTSMLRCPNHEVAETVYAQICLDINEMSNL